MSGRRIISNPGHCKLTAERIRRDAEGIAERLAKGELCREVAVDYDCCYNSFLKYAQVAIGIERWQVLVRPGVSKGHRLRQGVTQDPETDTGPHCWFCCKPIAPDTLVCGYCGTLLQG